MSVAYDSSASARQLGGTSAVLTYAYTATAPDYVVIGVSFWDNSSTITVASVTCNGVNATRLGGTSEGSTNFIDLWVLKAPASGTHNIVVTVSPTNNDIYISSGAIFFTGVDQTTPTGTLVNNNGSSTTASVVATSETNGVVVDVVNWSSDPSSVGAGQTERWHLDGSGEQGAGSHKDGAASVTMSWTVPNNLWCISAVPLKPVAAATADLATKLVDTSVLGYIKIGGG